MSLACVLARLRRRGRAYVPGVLVALLILVPLAHTSPPDAMWIAGIYDAADYDDVILAAAAMESLPHEGPILEGPVSLVASIVPAAGAAFAVANEVRIAQPRAPPTP